MRRARVLVPIASLGLALGVAACGDDGSGDDSTTTTEAADGSTATAPAGGDPGATTTTAGADDDDTATTSAATEDIEPGVPLAPPDLTSAGICEALPAEPVAAALGIAEVTAMPGGSGTPQCSYGFATAAGTPTDVTVAALRAEADLQGRVGDEAFAHVVDLNKAVAQAVTDTPIEVGDQAVVLSGNRLHMAVVQLGGRIVTVLVSAEEGDLAAITAVAQAAASALAP